MGFSDDILQIAKLLPEKRQTLLFSATMPPKIQKLAHSILHDPVEVKLSVSKPSENIDQSAVVCHEAQKTPVLKYLFKTYHSKRVIVFAASKLKVKDLSRELRRAGWKTGEMHSDLDQAQREQVMLDFKAGRIDILIATDIVARGIDIDDITMVVNYDVPRESEDYVHRIGRTARADADGEALTFVSDRDRKRWAGIERFLGKKIERMQLDDEPAGNQQSDRKTDRRRSDNRGRKPRNGAGKKTAPKEQKKNQTPEVKTEVKAEGQPAQEKKQGRQGGKRRWNRRRKGDAAGKASSSSSAENQ